MGSSSSSTKQDARRTFGRYIFFQHLSQSTFPPSIWIHRPSSIVFSQRTHTFVFGRLCALRRCSSRPVDSVGLVCERIGSFGDLDTLSRCASANGGRDEPVLVVGDAGLSSNRVSIARSSAPVDLAIVRDVDADRLRCGSRGDSVEEDEDEYLLSLFVMDGKRTLTSVAGAVALESAFVAGAAIGCGLVRNGMSRSASSSEFAYARPS